MELSPTLDVEANAAPSMDSAAPLLIIAALDVNHCTARGALLPCPVQHILPAVRQSRQSTDSTRVDLAPTPDAVTNVAHSTTGAAPAHNTAEQAVNRSSALDVAP